VVSFTTGRFNPRKRALGTHWIGGWVSPRAVLDTEVKCKLTNYARCQYRTFGTAQNEEDGQAWRKYQVLCIETVSERKAVCAVFVFVFGVMKSVSQKSVLGWPPLRDIFFFFVIFSSSTHQ
jgi:hypothetical protein